MIHMGDITKLNGAELPPVNVVIGGSPCQDLSVAGKRAGLDGERSGLFMDQLRIIKEMRKADVDRGRKGRDIRPRYMVWENVPGAFSSNKGEDFGAVLQETIKVIYEKAPSIPKPKNGWPTAGCLMGGEWSVAWRVLDAQFWGVPQRRRRIALVADFGGRSAPEILFERKGVYGNTQEGDQEEQTVASDAYACPIGNDKYVEGAGQSTFGTNRGGGDSASVGGFNGHKSSHADISFTPGGTPTIEANMPPDVVCIQGNCIDRADTAGCNGKGWTGGVCYTLNTIDRPAVAFEPGILKRDGGDNRVVADKAPTLRANMGDNQTAVAYSVAGVDGYNATLTGDKSATLGVNCGVSTGRNGVAYAIDNHPQDSRVKLSEDNVVQTLSGKMGTGGGNTPIILECYSQDAYDKYSQNSTAATLKNCGGSYGGGK